jgi:hypothetical protein
LEGRLIEVLFHLTLKFTLTYSEVKCFADFTKMIANNSGREKTGEDGGGENGRKSIYIQKTV